MPIVPFRARIVSTGSEILQGLYPDTNAQEISGILFREGFRILSHHAAPDNRAAIRSALEIATKDTDLVVMTGGLGPTEDDVNRDIIADLYQCRLLHDARAEAMMRERFEGRGITMPERNIVQAMLPGGCQPLYNFWGTAPGFLLPARSGLPVLVALPGPPPEWRPMLTDALATEILPLFPGRPARAVHTLHVAMTPESVINQALADLFESDEAVELTLLARRGHIRIRIVVRAASVELAEAKVQSLRAEVLRRIGAEIVYGESEDDMSIAEAVFRLLRDRGETLALAESCTGGWIAREITEISGSSAVLLAGWVTYSNESKMRDIQVPAELIGTYGAVSEQVARAMAEGARRISRATHTVAITGIAGPTGGTPEKPVGTVCIAVASPRGTITRTRRFNGDRSAIREYSAKQAMEMLRRHVCGIDVDAYVGGAMSRGS